MKRLLVFLMLMCMGLCACSESYDKSDMSGYEGFEDTDHVFVDLEVKDVYERMNRKETFAVYFGFAKCPWCIAALPVLNEEAKAAGVRVGYVDTRKDPSWESNLDLADYDLFLEMFGEYLDYDDDGIKHLYTPHVFFIKDGTVVYEHRDTVEGHVAYERAMSEEEEALLHEFYRTGFEKMK
ncbi:MAG: hypothetical protein Q4C20_08470 [Erysipelotrichaceae bacterium]|jgi:predicted bacteriocin transport accessory protein|nr:hypothetical protein [Erysipelotrichaceae bacterium]